MSSKIIRLTVQNLLRIQAAEVTPDGALVIVAGRNDQGKSSLLNCIGIALSGKNLPSEPIRKGASSGHVILETEQFVITRKFSQTGGGQLVVHDKEGRPVTQPQTKLEALYSLTTFDPLTFTRQEPKAQAATLRQLTGLDFSAIDSEYRTLFESRTGKNRQVTDQRSRLGGIARNPEAPTEPVDVSELTAKLEASMRNNELIRHAGGHVETLQRKVADARAKVTDLKQRLAVAEDHLEIAIDEMNEKTTHFENLKVIDLQELTQQISSAESTNIAIRENERWRKEHSRLLELETESSEMTKRLQAIQEEKAKLTAEAKFPVDGLGFSEEGVVTFDGHPFSQASSSKQILVSLAIACALNPNLRVMLIRDGSLLDADSLALVKDYAEKHEAQVFMECVGSRDDATVIIEDGQVIATPAADQKKGRK